MGPRRVRVVSGHLPPHDYFGMLLDAVFCLCPRGHAVHSPRLIEAILHGCIPVVLADSFIAPFSCFFDWHSFAVFVPEGDAARTAEILASFTADALDAMHAQLIRVRRFFAFREHASLPGAPDAFDIAMLEAYLRAASGVGACARLV